MLDDAMRVSFLVLAGLTLGIAAICYLNLLYQEIRGTGQIVIEPLCVIDNGGRANDELGKALAQMLQARLQSLVCELRDAQAGFTTKAPTSVSSREAPADTLGEVRLWAKPVELQTGLLQPIDIKLQVGGVDVGGILPWLQRRLSSRRTLHFTLYLLDSEVQISGSLAALRLPDAALRLRVKGADGKAPSLDVIVDGLAFEIVHRCLAKDATNRLEVLDSSEFTSLAGVLVSVAQANRKSFLGRPAQKEFESLIPVITALADKMPDWPELGYLAARVADSGKDAPTALMYYRRVQPKFAESRHLEVSDWINTRISELTAKPREASAVAAGAEPLPPAVDWSSEIGPVRSSGHEGSVVGQALATALEFQITKATKRTQRISARYIYYGARKTGGFDLNVDRGARLRDGITVLSNEGAVAEDVWPYRAGEFAERPPAAVKDAERFRITDVGLLDTLEDLKGALSENGPVVAEITLFEATTNEAVGRTGVIPLPTKKERIVGGTAIVIVGYDDASRRLKFVNSWGEEWGDQGFGYLPYDYVPKYLVNAWTFRLLTTTDGSSSAPAGLAGPSQ